MNILIIGSGGREHALAWKVAQSPLVKKIWVAPGNAGTALENKTSNIDIAPTDVDALLTFAKKNKIDLTIVGPEVALAAGVVDAFQAEKLAIFGPTQLAAQLESSKTFCKNFMRDHYIPTAHYATFREAKPAIEYLKQQNFPIVIKASGLAAGKGVVIAKNLEEAQKTVIDMIEDQRLGVAGNEIVIEEFLSGEELSFIVMVDGKNILPLASSQDHKRRDDGNKGPNTGGMGAYSPVPRLTSDLQEKILSTIIKPTVDALNKKHMPFVGFLYAGLMINDQDEPMVLEFNARLGDPETQPLMMRLKSDLVLLILAALNQQLDQAHAEWDERPAIGVVMAAGGYPEHYQKGDVIEGLNDIQNTDVKVFHAGTQLSNNKITTNGGRVLTVTALGNDLPDARKKAYDTIKKIHWPNCYYRTDIAS